MLWGDWRWAYSGVLTRCTVTKYGFQPYRPAILTGSSLADLWQVDFCSQDPPYSPEQPICCAREGLSQLTHREGDQLFSLYGRCHSIGRWPPEILLQQLSELCGNGFRCFDILQPRPAAVCGAGPSPYLLMLRGPDDLLRLGGSVLPTSWPRGGCVGTLSPPLCVGP